MDDQNKGRNLKLPSDNAYITDGGDHDGREAKSIFLVSVRVTGVKDERDGTPGTMTHSVMKACGTL